MHMDTVCAIRTISLQLNPTDPGVLAKESAKDPVLAKVMLSHMKAGHLRQSLKIKERTTQWKILSFTFNCSWLSAIWLQSHHSS